MPSLETAQDPGIKPATMSTHTWLSTSVQVRTASPQLYRSCFFVLPFKTWRNLRGLNVMFQLLSNYTYLLNSI